MLPSNPFSAAVDQFPDRIALVHPDGEFTYQELSDLATQSQLDLSDADPIACVAGEQSLAEYVQIFGCFLLGKPYYPINPKFPPERIAKIQSAITEYLQASNVDIEAAKQTALKNLAYIIFTSGSTGEPKGVPISQLQLTHYCAILQGILEINEHDRVLQLGDFSFDISIMAMAIAWPNGAALCAVPSAHVLMAPRYAEDLEITVWLSVPSVVSLAAKAGLLKPNSLPHLRLAIFGGEALTAETVEVFRAAAPHARLFNFWGPTEGTISLSHFEITSSLISQELADLAIMPIGHAHAEVQLALWDEGSAQFSPERGLLCASSPQLTLGYLNRPDLTESAFFMHQGKSWYRTGDLAKYDSQYGYRYLGRVDRQIKFKGYRIELSECENALRRISQSPEVCVVPWMSQGANADHANAAIAGLVGFVVRLPQLPPGLESEAEWLSSIEAHLQTALPSYMVPARLKLIDALPLNLSGKVDYKALEALASGLA